MITKYTPYLLIPPEAFIKEEMLERKLTKKNLLNLAKMLNISTIDLTKVLSGSKDIDKKIADFLTFVFESPDGYWEALQRNYNKRRKE